MRKILVTLFASLAVHAAPLALMRLPVAAARTDASPTTAEPIDRWSGTTADIAPERVYDVSVDPPGAGQPGAPALPSRAPVPSPPAKATAPTDPERSEPAPAKPSPPSEKPKRRSAATPDATAPVDDAATHRPRQEAARPSSAEGSAEDRGGGSRGGSFGAEGPSAVRDLGRAFTRAIPPACQADLTWSKLAAGEGGRIEVAIEIDETGHITGFKPAEDDPPKHLLALVKRTIALLEAGTFALRGGSVSRGTEVLRIQASMRDVGVDDGEAGGAAGLSFAYDRGKGKAGFTQAGGRHVDVSVEVVKVLSP
jgi:outer membrane biosynthesis protein TonB